MAITAFEGQSYESVDGVSTTLLRSPLQIRKKTMKAPSVSPRTLTSSWPFAVIPPRLECNHGLVIGA